MFSNVDQKDMMDKLQKAALDVWTFHNITMDSDEDVGSLLSRVVRGREELYGTLPKLDIVCQAKPKRESSWLEQAYMDLGAATIFSRKVILGTKFIENDIDADPAKLEILEASRVFKKEELSEEGSAEKITWDDFRSPGTFYDHDCYELKIDAALNWDRCCIFIGYRTNLEIAELMFASNLIPDGCEYILLIDGSRINLIDMIRNAVESNCIETDLDTGLKNGKALLLYADSHGTNAYYDDFFSCLPATKLASRTYITHEWSGLNDTTYSMIKFSPYPDMPEFVGRLFEGEQYAHWFLLTDKSKFMRRLANTNYLHTWDVDLIANNYLDTLSCGFATKTDKEDISHFIGGSYIYLDDTNDWCEDVIERWLDVHGKDRDLEDKVRMCAERLWGLDQLWKDVDVDWDTFKWSENDDTRRKMLTDVCPEGASSYVDCFWNHGVPVEDVFAQVFSSNKIQTPPPQT